MDWLPSILGVFQQWYLSTALSNNLKIKYSDILLEKSNFVKMQIHKTQFKKPLAFYSSLTKRVTYTQRTYPYTYEHLYVCIIIKYYSTKKISVRCTIGDTQNIMLQENSAWYSSWIKMVLHVANDFFIHMWSSQTQNKQEDLSFLHHARTHSKHYEFKQLKAIWPYT